MDERTGSVKHEDTDAIRRDIERTQREMSRTIEEIQYRLSPRHMMEQTKQSVREAGLKTSRGMMQKIKANPIPAAMVGIGLYLLARDNDESEIEYGYGQYAGGGERMPLAYSSVSEYRDLDAYGTDQDRSRMAGARSKVDEARHKVSEAAGDAKERVHDAVDSARETAQETMHNLGDRASQFGSQARYMGRQTRDTLQENPVALGLLALALGAVVGALIPETDRENQLMGATRDRLADRGKELAKEGVDKAKDVAGSVATAATQAAKEATRGDAGAGSPGSMSGRTDVAQSVGVGSSSSPKTGADPFGVR